MTQAEFDNSAGSAPSGPQIAGRRAASRVARRRGARAWFGFALAQAICFAAAAIGGWLTSRTLATWYPGLAKPSWNPPDWVFAPVWTVLYAMMACAAWLVGRERGWRAAAFPLGLFAAQLALNVAWSGLFFALQSPGAALVDVILLWLLILATLVSFWRVNAQAGLLLVPYLGWVSFAAVLNCAIWQLNR